MPDVPFCHVSPSHASDAPLDVLDLAAMAQRWNDLVMTRHPNSESVVACVDMLPSDIQQDLAQVLASRWLPDAPSIRRQRQDTASTIRNNDGDSDDDAWGSQDEVDEVPSHVQTSWTSEGEADQVVEDGGGADGSDIDGTSDVMEILLDVYRLLLINNPRAQRQARHRLQSVLLPLVGQFDMRGSDLSELTGTGADNDLRRLVEQLVEDDPIALVDVGLT
ncbi:hypothetical protein DYB32_007296 [Aphanomyces invadans]|uniref:Uncharacterized protein n=1 Tax=Aphanomyces invadans TaxID=157072 RepID=A0A3R6YA73_9STRA|nr:hypothetical protein DYB32_007296 [Aphanomyces invadans]